MIMRNIPHKPNQFADKFTEYAIALMQILLWTTLSCIALATAIWVLSYVFRLVAKSF